MNAQGLPTMWIRGISVLLLTLLPVSASAGAWQRGEGSVFAALSLESSYDRSALTWDDTEEEPPLARNYLKFYGEYGITDRLTFGIELDQDYLFLQRQAIAFVSAAVVPDDWLNRISIELGFGQREGPFGPGGREDSEMVARPGLAVGRGFETRFGPAWSEANFKVEHRVDTEEQAYKLDLTLGIRPEEDTLYYGQLQNSDYPMTDFASRLLLSRVSQMNRFLWLETGVFGGLRTDDSVGFKFGIWAEF
jgi:hypothetical protein